ncbi:MAG: cell division protein ZapA [Flavobacteriaceae bacterium]|nr:cell division protein ZapA [Flavobacteriaceae bacterium]
MKITIAGRQYPMTVHEHEEETIRKAGKEINEMIKIFEQKYDIRDKQDALAMCALQFVSKSMTMEKSESDNDTELAQRLQNIIQLIDKQLN